MPSQSSSTRTPRLWTPSEFLSAIGSHNTVLVRVADADSRFNGALRISFLQRFPKAQFGILDITKLDNSPPEILQALSKFKTQLGWFEFSPLLRGYYLFVDHQAVAYHPGTASRDELGASALGGALTLLGVFLQENKLLSALSTGIGQSILENGPGQRMFSVFSAAAEAAPHEKSDHAEGRKRRQEEVIEDETQKAYEILEISENATNDELKSSWRTLISKWHPDLAGSDEVERRNRTEMTTQLNTAYGLLMRSRGLR